MAALDPDVAELLLALLATPVAPRALAALQGIVEEPEADAGEGRVDRGVPRSRWDQLDHVERVIAGGIKRDILAARRLRDISPGLGVAVISIVPTEAVDAAPSLSGSLLDLGRETASLAFIDTLGETTREMRRRWE